MRRKRKRLCPLCRPAEWMPTDIPMLRGFRRAGKIPAYLAECCGTIFVDVVDVRGKAKKDD